jgi:hypothetical protein
LFVNPVLFSIFIIGAVSWVALSVGLRGMTGVRAAIGVWAMLYGGLLGVRWAFYARASKTDEGTSPAVAVVVCAAIFDLIEIVGLVLAQTDQGLIKAQLS